MPTFDAFRIRNDEQGYRSAIETMAIDDLMAGEVLLECRFSSINYKDALAASGTAQVVRHFPINGGIDCAGEVVESSDSRFRPGDLVLATGYGLGVSHDGGFAAYVRLPADWLVKIPGDLGPFMAMALGTAGFTAGLALERMEQNGQTPDQGPILVTGASGGVGNCAIALFARNGYEVIALSGKPDKAPHLRALGASEVLSRTDLTLSQRPLDKARWAGIVDSVGGAMLAGLLPQLMPRGNVASIGLAGGSELHGTLMPFILRGASLLGIDSVACPRDLRQQTWHRLAEQLDRALLDQMISRVVGLQDLKDSFAAMLAGKTDGRILVDPHQQTR
jgi:acrylyl-CoA reductase (NADPH)